jgi:hypothetical protein
MGNQDTGTEEASNNAEMLRPPPRTAGKSGSTAGDLGATANPKLKHNPKLEADMANKLLITLDVSSLYTNINIDMLCNDLHNIDPMFAMISYFVCYNNYFQYKDDIYHQINGIAMGTNAAVAMANIYLGIHLDPFLALKLHCYRRYIDDIFGISSDSLQRIEISIAEWNTMVPKINFTQSISMESVDFLDITIYKNPTDKRTLVTKTHHKAISKFLYLPYNSLHPESTFKGLITGMLKRFE